MKEFFTSKKFIYGIITGVLIIILGVVGVFGYKKYQVYQAEKQVAVINDIVDAGITNRDTCKIVLDFDKSLVSKDNEFFKETTYDAFRADCDNQYNIANAEMKLEFCSEVIKGRKGNFSDRYIVLDTFFDVQKQCSLKYLTATFSTGSFFDIENDFKSSVHVNFSLPFFEDIVDTQSEEFLKNRIEAKKRLVGLLEISPKVDFDEEDIVLYEKKAILEFPLEPLKEYTFSLKSFDSGIEGEKVRSEKFVLKTPENKFFGFRILKKMTLFQDTASPKLELLSYDSGKTKTKFKICRIDNETYAKIEVFQSQKGLAEAKKKFFTSGIDSLKTFDCKEKEVSFTTEKSGTKLQKTTFDFTEEIGNPARSGLYYVTFSDPEDRVFNERVQPPVFFGIIDSHITMKISRNGEAFFFVNDFSGKPLANQNIRVYANEFVAKDTQWNREKGEYDVTYFSPLEKNVFGTSILLGKTGSDGVLKVDMKGKIDDVFDKTFDSWDYDWDGNYNSFFITSASDSNLTYVSSKWNGGISAWNFGYTLGDSWWYGGNSENADEIQLERWSGEESVLYSHTYTDRKLYLPGEEVHIKSVVRNSADLSIPKGKELTFKVTDANGDDILEKILKVSEFGSLSEKLKLPSSAPLGSYQIYLYDGDSQVGNSGFSVEVFKNPKFKNEVMLKTTGLNGELIKIKSTDVEKTDWGYERKTYTGDFKIQASISSQYYSGSPVKSGEYDYKVYKQYYYDNSYWDDCYYGCYWEPEKEFYTEGKGHLDDNGSAIFEVPVEFKSNYSDYKYIVEVTVRDTAGDQISGTNSIIAKLPSEFKRWDPNSGVYFKSEKRFYKQGEKVTLEGGLINGKFGADYNDKFLLIIKKKDYKTSYVDDVRGYKRPVTSVEETVEKIFEVNDTNFKLGSDGKLKLNYTLKQTGEYVFEFGKIDDELFFNSKDLIAEFEKTGEKYLSRDFSGKLEVNWDNFDALIRYCDESKDDCSDDNLLKQWGCSENYIDDTCRGKEKQTQMSQKFKASNLIDSDSRKYFTLISYGDANAKNPVQSDNKITVLSEKVSYHLGDTARVLVRLPFSKGKILWTIEKQGVIEHEYIDVPGNTFFKEFRIDDSFIPNTYIGVVAIDTDSLCPPDISLAEGDKNNIPPQGGGERGSCVPEYKVGYTEVVVDKTDKKTQVSITPNKKKYEPREEVILNISVKDTNRRAKKSELTVMVVDDSLISLMGNIDMNTLEKFYKKLPFQIQTSITNLAMLKNYYFSRQGVVGGSGFGNFKGGDSAVSSRSIFKNTAYYNPSVITDSNGKATVQFLLPDNLTNFRVMVISNSKDNFFGYSEDFIEVRKDVIVEDRTPLIIRDGDKIVIGANVFNTTDKEIGFKATLTSQFLNIGKQARPAMIGPGKSEFISWEVTATPVSEMGQEKIPYTISILGDSAKHSDKIQGSIAIAQSPVLLQNNFTSESIAEGKAKDFTLKLPNNTNTERSTYELSISNNPLAGIEKILSSLAVYPYGCIEQTLSSTMPNAVLSKFLRILPDLGVSKKTIDKNLSAGIERLKSMHLENGGFGYWQGDSSADLAITPYVLRSLLEIQESGGNIEKQMIQKTAGYLEKNYSGAAENTQIEILWALARLHRGEYKGGKLTPLGLQNLTDSFDRTKMSRHDLIAYTYALVLADSNKYKNVIDDSIKILKEKINNKEQYNYSIHYYDGLDDKAIFTQMLIDYSFDSSYVSERIMELYGHDWSSYYYSTKTKNDAFLAFAKYIETYGKDNLNTLKLTLNGKSKQIQIGEEQNSYKTIVPLSEVLENDQVSLQIENKKGTPFFVTASIHSYPADPLKVPSYSNGVQIKREIYEVTDATKLQEKCNWSNGNRTCTQASGLTLHNSDTFKKGTTYKVKLIATFDENNRRQNLVIEDYLPASFRILNSQFQTNSIATSQNSSQKSWQWSHVENRPEVVMAHAKYTWGNTATYNYFVVTDFAGSFIYPPVTTYMMYQPETRANGEFRRIEVR